jgi:hypothetical protein
VLAIPSGAICEEEARVKGPRWKGGSYTSDAYGRSNGSAGFGLVSHEVPRSAALRAVVR